MEAIYITENPSQKGMVLRIIIAPSLASHAWWAGGEVARTMWSLFLEDMFLLGLVPGFDLSLLPVGDS